MYWILEYRILYRANCILLLDALDTGIQNTVQSKPVFICLDVLDTGIQNTVQSKPVFKF